jgi:hypothetical protein
MLGSAINQKYWVRHVTPDVKLSPWIFKRPLKLLRILHYSKHIQIPLFNGTQIVWTLEAFQITLDAFQVTQGTSQKYVKCSR